MDDISLSSASLRHFRGAWIFAAAIILVMALVTISGLAAQLANQDDWDADSGASPQAQAN
jgi:hypothetical protein